MKVKCPTCRERTEWEHNPYRPFCSERCKLIDLGAWASGDYVIEGPPSDEASEMSPEKETNND